MLQSAREKTYVNIALKRLAEAAKTCAAPQPGDAGGGEKGPSLARTAAAMGQVLDASSARGPGQRRGGGSKRKRRSKSNGMTFSIPISAPDTLGSTMDSTAEGGRLDADHPSDGGLVAGRPTPKRMPGRKAASAMASASARSFGGKTSHRIVFLSASLWRFTNGVAQAAGTSRTACPCRCATRPRWGDVARASIATTQAGCSARRVASRLRDRPRLDGTAPSGPTAQIGNLPFAGSIASMPIFGVIGAPSARVLVNRHGTGVAAGGGIHRTRSLGVGWRAGRCEAGRAPGALV